MFRNQLASLIQSERIITTLPKAKELRPQIERLITLAKNDSVHARRKATRLIADETIVAKLFDTVGPRFSTRPGGYTRIIKLGPRRGDAAEMAILEFVGFELAKEETASAKAGKKKATEPAADEPKETKEAKESEEAAPAADAKPKKAPAKKTAPKKKAETEGGKGKPKKAPAKKSAK